MHDETPRPQRSRARAYVSVALALFFAGLVVDAVYVGVRLRGTLLAAAEDLGSVGESLADGKLERARSLASNALERATEARELTRHPSVKIASRLPFIGRDATALAALSEATVLSAEAGVQGTLAARVLGVEEGGIARSVYSEGKVRLDAVRAAGPFVSAASDFLIAAGQTLGASAEPRISIIAEALDEARREIEATGTSARRGAALFDTLPSLLGERNQKRYLLVFQALGEARATGGLFGTYGVLRARDGRMSLETVGPIAELVGRLRGSVAPPSDWYATSYGGQSALHQFQQVNISPDFPSAAEVALRMYQSVAGASLDGVIAMDPIALGELMKATGPITTRLYPEPITSDNAADALLRDAYLRFGPDEQNLFLAEVVARFWDRVRTGDLDEVEFVKRLGEATATGHVKVYPRGEEDQAAMRVLEADGSYDARGPHVQLVYSNNYGVNKIDYFTHRELQTRIELAEDGSASIRTVAVVTNRAPAGPPSQLLGPGLEGDPAGLNRTQLAFLLPVGAEDPRIEVDGKRGDLSTHKDGEHLVAWDVVELPPGATRTMTITYLVPGFSSIDDGDGSATFTLWPQTTVNPDRYEVTIVAPEGYVFSSGEDTIHDAGALERPRTLVVSFEAE